MVAGLATGVLDHVTNLGWSALLKSIVLGDSGKKHTDTLEALVKAGANVKVRSGSIPLMLARNRGYEDMAKVLDATGAR